MYRREYRVSLTVRKTGPVSLAYQQWADYTVYDDGRAIGRIYEDRATRPALRWFWSIAMIDARHTGIRTEGCTPTLKQAKAELQANWRKAGFGTAGGADGSERPPTSE